MCWARAGTRTRPSASCSTTSTRSSPPCWWPALPGLSGRAGASAAAPSGFPDRRPALARGLPCAYFDLISGRNSALMTGSGISRLFRAAAFAVPVVVALSAATIGAAGADDGQGPAGGGGGGAAGADDGQGPAGAGAGAAQQAPGTLPAQPAPVNRPGFLHQLEAWFNDGFADFNTKMKN